MYNESSQRRDKALWRYQIISAYLALDPPRGQRKKLLEELAARTWTNAAGERVQVAAETIRSWVRRYRLKGLEGLEDKARAKRGVGVLTPEQIELVCGLKREVPERSLDRIIRIVEDMKLVEPGVVRRSTLHRVLQAHGISQRPKPEVSDTDLDRFEADNPNELWQSDMRFGPWLPDPQRPGKMRRTYLYAFIDDHSRLLLHGRYAFKGDLPALELVFRRCLQRWGKPTRVYYDNGQTYRSGHMKQVVATTGIHRIVHSKRYRPMGKGKIEALNQLILNAFQAEVKASSIRTLDELNEAFIAWADVEYNKTTHSETGQKPIERWRAGIDDIEYLDEELLEQAFLWRERRTPDKTAIFSLFGTRYQVDAELARKRIEIRYDPEALEEVEVWYQGEFRQRTRPYQVQSQRRPTMPADEPVPDVDTSTTPPRANWLGHLVAKRREQQGAWPQRTDNSAGERRAEADRAVVELLAGHLDADVFDHEAITRFLSQYGPFEPALAERTVAQLIERSRRNDQHVSFYLDAIKAAARGAQ